eukprot:c12866_g1_i1.p1 GENE.c12866_g1_i1~~c12866_g1_i1.p1  ORF type:complete len:612 (-),score=102.30 c12866_g1_i1:148-1983(-)
MGVEAERVEKLRIGRLPKTERFAILQAIYDSFMHFDSDFVRRANAYVAADIINVCFDIEQEGDENDKIKVVYILGMMCFNNEPATDQVGAHPNFYDLLSRTLRRSNALALMRAGLYLMTNASSNSFSTHPILVKLLPRIREIIDRSSGYNQGTRSEGVRVCFYLASNEQSKAALLEAGVIEPLVDIMSSGILELDCVSAAIAVSNLVGEEEDSPALSAAAGADGFYKLLVDALEASLNGTDYPVGSNLFYRNWKVVQGLANLSKADINKEKMGASGLVAQLKRCLDQDDTDGRLHEYTVQALWQLSFHEANHSRIREHIQLKAEIERLAEHGASETIRQAAQGILWQIGKDYPKKKQTPKPKINKTTQLVAPSPQAQPEERVAGHIMCSYSWVQQPLMVKVKERLEREGYKMWMDLDNMAGSTLESMAAAVEGAEIVLIGLSKDYKNSGACRTESEFAYKLKKDIVPLVLEPGYSTDGWLGAMMGSRLYYDVSDDSKFEATMNNLIRFLGNRCKKDSFYLQPSNSSSRPKSAVEEMSTERVSEWLESVGLGKYSVAFVHHQMDGQSLACANLIAQKSSNSYNAIKDDFMRTFNMSLGEVYKFMWLLKNLCQ